MNIFIYPALYPLIIILFVFNFCSILLAGDVDSIGDDKPSCSLSFFGGAAGPAEINFIILEDLEPLVSEAPESLVVVAELEEKLHKLEREIAVSGLKMFAGAGVGYHREEVGEDDMEARYSGRLSLGLHYPLLGSRGSERINVLKAEGRVWEVNQRVRAAELTSLAALRSQYVLLWGTQEQIKLSHAFLADEFQVKQILENRENKGLLLGVDKEEFLTTFFLARRNIATLTATKKRAVANINLLTNGHSGLSFAAVYPLLPEPYLDESGINAFVLDRHPELIRLRGLIEEQIGVIGLADFSDVKARISLTGYGDVEHGIGMDEYGVQLQFSMDMPWNFSRAAKAEISHERATLRKLQRKLDMLSGQFLAEVGEGRQRYLAALENKRFAAQRVKAAIEGVRESVLRRDYIAGDSFEQLQRSRYLYYQAAMDYINGEVSLLHARTRLLAFKEGEIRETDAGFKFDSVINCNYLKPLFPPQDIRLEKNIPVLERGKRSKTETPDVKKTREVASKGYGVYVWDTEKMFTLEKSNPAFWEYTRKSKIKRMLLSFNRGQLDNLMIPAGERQLSGFIKRANANGIDIGLLLGEPTWMLPEYRHDLLSIVDRFYGMGFSQVHLDLEPNQLAHLGLPYEYLLAHLLRTVQAVANLVPIPVELDLHPRYLREETADFCLGCGLQNLDDVRVTLMIYVRNNRRVIEIARPILDEFPGIYFDIAQSVEPQLTAEESYAGVAVLQFHESLSVLQEELGSRVGIIYIQSWQDYMNMVGFPGFKQN